MESRQYWPADQGERGVSESGGEERDGGTEKEREGGRGV